MNFNLPEKTGVGTLIISSSTARALLCLRSPHKTHPMQWSLFGGMMEENEQPKNALLRELSEEMNFIPDIERIYPFDVYTSKDGHFKYYSFVSIVEDEFIPILNDESCGYCWVNIGNWPKPMHQGAKTSFCNQKATSRLHTLLSNKNVN